MISLSIKHMLLCGLHFLQFFNGFNFLSFLFFFLGLHLRHMEFPRLRVKLELHLPAYTTATATQDPSYVCYLHHSSQQHQILSPPSKARDQTHNLIVPSQIHFRCTTTGTPSMVCIVDGHTLT